MEIMLKKKLAEKKQFLSAQTIQSRFRGYICRKWFKRVYRIRTTAAIRIQRCWRRYYRQVVMPRQQAWRERQVVGLIQKCCRGWIARRKLLHERAEQKADLTYEYFMKIEEKLRVDTGLFIRYYADKWWRKVKKKIQMSSLNY